MKQFFKKYIDNIKNHPEPQKFARANLILAFLLAISLVIVVMETANFLRAVFLLAIPLLIIDNLVCYVIARKVARKNETKKTD